MSKNMTIETIKPIVHGVVDTATSTITYIVHSGHGSACAVIDPVLNYDAKSGRTSKVSADNVIAYIRGHDLKTLWILETHAHADHLSAAPYLKQELGAKTAIGQQITKVQTVFKGVFGLEESFQTNGAQFDHLLAPNEPIVLGDLVGRAIAVPGHTPACMAFQFGNTVFVGDTLFMPDVGTARCDFPGGSAHDLYQSIQEILSLPPQTRLFMCHDYPPNGREFMFESTVAQQREHNIHARKGINEQEFTAMRSARDATLAMPVLMLPSVQVNIRAGNLPPKDPNGVSYLRIPINLL
jgi:glyoxylase-like metal-dependent hydrolase (beta-lactamase superfamily II)